jgi:hypothetical protein
MRRVHGTLFALAVSVWCASGAGAEDEGTLAIVLPKLASSAARLEGLLKKASFTVTGHMESVGGDGAISDPKDGIFKIVSDGTKQRFEVVRVIEDGKDKTEEAKKKAADREKERASKKPDPDKEAHVPFLASEQPKYNFRAGETDSKDPARIRIFFDAKSPAENLFNGSAWVDTRNGEILSAGFAPAKTPTFVDYVKVTVELGEKTTSGPAVSKLNFEAGGGFLFFRKKVRGWATVTEWAVP